MILINFLRVHWRKIAIAVAILVCLEFIYRGISKQKAISTSREISTATASITISDASSSLSTGVAGGSVSTVNTSKASEVSQVKTITREKFRPDGSLESRETEKIETEKKQNIATTVHATESVVLSQEEKKEASSSLTLTEQASSSEQVVFSDSNQVGIGPAAWVTVEGTYAGLSYRVFDISLLKSNVSVVVGTRIGALPDLDLAVGGLVSKPVAPGLEFGIVGIVKVPNPDGHIGIGISYQF